ncbi:MAG: DUF1634 domain-containing protein [Thaumarchaeota archaeon]|nr:DUF1634 domain-containing protein [Nitrososphaerota archaeon]
MRPDSEEDRSFDKKRYARMQTVLARTLLYGVVLSTVIIVIGLAAMALSNKTGYLCDNSGDSLNCLLNYNPSAIPHGDYPNNLVALASGLEQLKPFSIIQLGVLVLLATPVIRVTASLILFSIEKDRSFVLITLFVLLVLLFSFFIVPEIPIFKA